jgi:hypothetical protein
MARSSSPWNVSLRSPSPNFLLDKRSRYFGGRELTLDGEGREAGVSHYSNSSGILLGGACRSPESGGATTPTLFTGPG